MMPVAVLMRELLAMVTQTLVGYWPRNDASARANAS
jgi:hypothetical protein